MSGDIRTVVIPVSYNAEMGGLQEHVRAQASGLKRHGYRPVVVCRVGPFGESLGEDGIERIVVSFDDLEEATDLVLRSVQPDIVHAHPFRARRLGLSLSEAAGCPLFVTFHGQYAKRDAVTDWWQRVAGVVAVSPGIRDHLTSACPELAAKTVVLPNAVDLARFRPSSRRRNRSSTGISVLVPSRFDEDKERLVDLLEAAWQHQAASGQSGISWVLAGDGTRLDDLRLAASRLDHLPGASVRFLGWQSSSALRRLYRQADACLAPGRSALEAMASGVPTFAAGSKGYTGPVWSSPNEAMYSNFGGFAGVSDDAAFPDDLERFLLLSKAERDVIGRSLRSLASAFYDQRRVDIGLSALYGIHLAGTG